MSRVSEWINLIPKGLPNTKNILQAWLKDIKLENGKLSEEETEEILRRRAICTECPFNSINAQTSKEYKELKREHYKTDRAGLHCSFCGCPIKTKTASLESNCGIEDYNEEHKDNIQELKWIKYD